ncbi:hypothetical protein EG329_013876 [Mollisiaceae sp. DMI_Dod_QoI]|nr:hypothetical protein EG329_013876 [Helotiales sp. DMI_Dod_QoI]
MSYKDPDLEDLSYPVCERARDILMTYEQTPRSQHLPRGPTAYYPHSDILHLLREESRGRKVFLCNCLRCQKQAGLQGGIDNRVSRWDETELLGKFATIYALLIYLRCPGLISIFRRNEISLDKGYLSHEQLRFLDNYEILTALQAANICNEIVRTQYQFRVRKFSKRNEITIIDERETLPIHEDHDAAGKGDFGEVYPFDVRPEYVDETLKPLQTNRFARKIFKQLPTESKPVKEFVLQQLKSSQFQHRHLMPALAAFEHGRDYFFILFELAESTLYKFLAGDGPSFTTQELWNQVHGLASGLAYLHGISVEGDQQNNGRMIHRDLKPANVLIVGGVMKIADFGFASYKPWPTTTDSRATESSLHQGINNYSPPPSDEACEKYDVYSLGAIMSEIACFDIGKESRVAQYRQNRFDDALGEQHNRSRRFYYYERNDMKISVTEEHSSLLKVVREESKHPHTTLHPWQEFFFQPALFDMIGNMLHESKSRRPKAADVADMLREFATRADIDIAQNVDDRTEHYMVKDWVETLITSPPGPAELKNRFIADFAENKRCALWLYPDVDNRTIRIFRFQYTFDKRGLTMLRETELYVNRNQKTPYAGIKPVYLDDTKGNAVNLISRPEEHLVYKFPRLSDTLRFQGVMTGEHIYKCVSLQIVEFSLRNYHKPSSPFKISRNKKSKDKKQIVRGRRAHVQMWTREKPDSLAGPNVKVAIISEETLHIIKVTGHFVQDTKGLTKLDPPPPSTVVRLAFAETYSIDISDGIPLIFNPSHYENHEEVRLYFRDEDDAKSFWRNLIELQQESFPANPRRTDGSSGDAMMTRNNKGGSQKTARSRESVGPRSDNDEHRRFGFNILPPGHTGHTFI